MAFDIFSQYQNFDWKNTAPLSKYLESLQGQYAGAFVASEFDAAFRKACSGDAKLVVDLRGGGIDRLERKDMSVTQSSGGGLMEFTGVMTQFDGENPDLDGDIVEPIGGTVDSKSSLLMFHDWDLPVGRFVAVTEQNANIVRVKNLIADTELGHDACGLIEVGALRMSHGFESLECQAIEKPSPSGHMVCTGIRFTKWKTREITLTPMPANENAIIEAWSRKKLKNTKLNMIAKSMNEKRSKSVSVNISGDSIGSEIGGLLGSVAEHFLENLKKRAEQMGILKAGDSDTKPQDNVNPDDDATGDGKKKEDDSANDDKKPSPEGGNSSGGTLSEMMASLQSLQSGEIPETAKNRIATVLSIAGEVQGMLSSNAEKIAAAADSENIEEMFAGVSDIISDVVFKLSEVCDEIDKIAAMEGMDASRDTLVSIQASCKAVMEAIGGALDAANAADGKNDDEGGGDKKDDGGASGSDPDIADVNQAAMNLAGALISGKSLSQECRDMLLFAIN